MKKFIVTFVIAIISCFAINAEVHQLSIYGGYNTYIGSSDDHESNGQVGLTYGQFDDNEIIGIEVSVGARFYKVGLVYDNWYYNSGMTSCNLSANLNWDITDYIAYKSNVDKPKLHFGLIAGGGGEFYDHECWGYIKEGIYISYDIDKNTFFKFSPNVHNVIIDGETDNYLNLDLSIGFRF